MANGGFKAFQVEMTGLSGSATLAERKTAASTLLQEIGTKLVALGEGWGYDGDCSSTGVPCAYPEGAFSDMGTTAQTLYLGFVHTSGTKMLMTYNVYETAYSISSFVQSNSNSTYTYYGSLAISMIPNGCGSYNYNSANPIPAGGLLLHGQCAPYNGAPQSIFYAYTEGYKFRYTLIVRGTQIITVSQTQNGNTGYNQTRATIKIYGSVLSCAQSEDTFSHKEFATIDTYYSDSSVRYEYNSQINDGYGYACNMNSSASYSQFFSYNGTRISGYNNGAFARADSQACECMYSITSKARFFPIHVYTARSGGCSTSGDGYKGIVNPEVACIVTKGKLAMGTLLDSGNFIMLVGGLVVGWDPSNTVNFN